MDLNRLVLDLLTILGSGFLAGVICKSFNVSLLLGYLVAGVLIGEGGLALVDSHGHELEYVSEAGALLLLFAVGIEFSLDELIRMRRNLLLGGAVQMLLVALPLTGLCRLAGMSWNAAILGGFAGSLSSTILVFKALTEYGQASTSAGRRGLAILLFQDVALVPLLLLVPLLTGAGEAPNWKTYALLAGKSLIFLLSVVVLHQFLARGLVPLLARLRSIELVVLFAVCVLASVSAVSNLLGLPPAVGALAAGLILSGQRLTKQIDTVLLPFRETFSVVFFVSLGLLLRPRIFLDEPVLLTLGLAGMLALKMGAAATALRITGLPWGMALGLGLGLSQLGEFSMLLLREGTRHQLFTERDRGRMTFIALGTLLLTPALIRWGLRGLHGGQIEEPARTPAGPAEPPLRRALVVGIGPIGRRLAGLLETYGCEVCLIDRSAVNLYEFAQMGFPTIAGDARQSDVLERAEVARREFAVVSVPDDDAAREIVLAIRKHNPRGYILVRCRLGFNVAMLKRAGASDVVSEEMEASGRLQQLCEAFLARQPAAEPVTTPPKSAPDPAAPTPSTESS